MEMISEMKERRHTFTDSDNIFLDLSGDKTMGFVDFKGNRREVPIIIADAFNKIEKEKRLLKTPAKILPTEKQKILIVKANDV